MQPSVVDLVHGCDLYNQIRSFRAFQGDGLDANSPSTVSRIVLICTFLFIGLALCLHPPTNPVIIFTHAVLFFMCQKGNGLCLIECGLFDVRKLQRQMAHNHELAHPPVHIYQNIVQLAIYSLYLSLCPQLVLYHSPSLSLSPEEAFSFQRQNLEEEKESLVKQQKECTAKRYI